MNHSKISGGFILKPKCIKNSKISTSTPCTREVWDWLLMNAEHKDGNSIKRGQLFLRYKVIIEGLVWYVGYRKMTYSSQQIKTAMHNLRDNTMITTTKTPTGVLITILNYDKYQTLSNYVNTNVATNELPHANANNHYKGKKKKEEIIKEIYPFDYFWETYDKKVDKKPTLAKWKKIKDSDKEIIYKTVADYIKSKPDKKYRASPLVYLNKERWNDEIITNNKSGVKINGFNQGYYPESSAGTPNDLF